MKANTKKTIRYFLDHAKNYKKWVLLIGFSTALAVATEISVPYLYKTFFDTLVEGESLEQIRSALTRIILLVLGLNLLEWVFWRIVLFSMNYFVPSNMRDISNECFDYLHKHSYDFFNNNFAGALVKKVSRLVYGFDAIASMVVWDLIPLFVRSTIILTLLYLTHPLFGISFTIWAIAFMAFNYFFSTYKLKFDIAKAKQDSKVTAYLADTIANNINIKLFASLNYERNQFKEITTEWYKRNKFSWDLGALVESVQALLMIGLEFFIFYFAIGFWNRGILSIGDFVLIQAYLFTMFHQLWGFGRVIRNLYEQFANAEEMIVIFNTPHEIISSKGAKRLKVTRGAVEFKEVSFQYQNNRHVIKNLTLSVKPGEKIALIGPSGEGKSTLVKLLLRLHDINEGDIVIDNQSIKKVKLEDLRRNISLVPQDPILFHRSLFENILYGCKNATREEVIAASKLAYCHKFIEELPEKYDTYVGERGVKLSGGQRQRIAIARAILRNAPILVLDEATSSLDSHSESLIQQALANLMKNKTTLIIAHRLSTIAQMDRIIVLKQGQIVEQGTHADLIAKEDSLYKKLWDLQVGGYQKQEALNP